MYLCDDKTESTNEQERHVATRENISISFTPEQAAFLAGCVKSGRYQSTSEVVREAIRLLEDRESQRQRAIQRAQQLIEEGARQLDAGQEIDIKDVFAELDAKPWRRNNTTSGP
jgi:antitoxin ParD1/3/4